MYIKQRPGVDDYEHICADCGKSFMYHRKKKFCLICGDRKSGIQTNRRRYKNDFEFRKKQSEFHRQFYRRNKKKIQEYACDYHKKTYIRKTVKLTDDEIKLHIKQTAHRQYIKNRNKGKTGWKGTTRKSGYYQKRLK